MVSRARTIFPIKTTLTPSFKSENYQNTLIFWRNGETITTESLLT
jgi:hypothetical protein